MALSPRIKHALAALATFSALLNVWVLAVHTEAVISDQLHLRAESGEPCHHAGAKLAQENKQGQKPTPTKNCPVCSGLASLHIAVLSHSLPEISAPLHTEQRSGKSIELALDRRPLRTLNRGPPFLV